MRVPFFYGWVVVAVAFATMAVGVNARTAFSLFFPPILAEFGWERGRTAGVFAFGFLVSNLFIPFLGRAMDRWGPRLVLPAGVLMVCAGLGLATLTRLVLRHHPTAGWLAVMVGAQGLLGYGIASVFGAIVAELFQGRHYGSIFGVLGLGAGLGAGLGPLTAGLLYDLTGRYAEAFWVAIGCCAISTIAIWQAAPRKVRVVAGRLPRARVAAR